MSECVTHASGFGEEIQRHFLFIVADGRQGHIRVIASSGVAVDLVLDCKQPQDRLGELQIFPDEIVDSARVV
jgi:hypothetical protein